MTNSFFAHNFSTSQIVTIPSLNYVVSIGNYDSVKVWSSLTWTLVRSFSSTWICTIEFLDNSLVALGSRQWYIHTWDVSSGVNQSLIPKLPTTPVSLKSLKTGNLLAAGMFSGWIFIVNYTNGVSYRNLSHCSTQIYTLELINSSLLASGCGDGTIKIWNWQLGMSVFNLTGHTASVNILKLVTATMLASGSTDTTIKLWDITSGALLKNLTGHTDQIWALDLFSSCVLISGSLDMTLIQWDLMNGGKMINSIGSSMKVRSLAVLPPINRKFIFKI